LWRFDFGSDFSSFGPNLTKILESVSCFVRMALPLRLRSSVLVAGVPCLPRYAREGRKGEAKGGPQKERQNSPVLCAIKDDLGVWVAVEGHNATSANEDPRLLRRGAGGAIAEKHGLEDFYRRRARAVGEALLVVCIRTLAAHVRLCGPALSR
jgi:hypothetical protein